MMTLFEDYSTRPKLEKKLLEELIGSCARRTCEDRAHFAALIRNPKIDTGLVEIKKKKRAKNSYYYPEDKQAFGAFVGKFTTAKEAHSYPLSSIPLAFTSPERKLRQGTKADLRNLLINNS